MTEPDSAERLSADDLATLRAEQFTAAALAAHRGGAQPSRPGTCANCGCGCLPAAVYCDDDCRADHQHRQGVLRRQGRAA